MKRIILTLCLALTAAAASAQYVDDMYDTSPSKPKKQPTNSYQQPSPSDRTDQVSSNQNENKELITSYEEALQRRLNALRNTVEMDEAYWQLLQQYQGILEAKYDKNLYNIVVVGNDMWVEPQWITSLFDGSDPAQGVIQYNDQIKKALTMPTKPETASTSSSSVNNDGGGGGNQTVIINLNVDPWYNSGWNYGWGYPYNYGWGYGWGASYGWGGGWYDPWYNPWHHHHYNPWYNPWYTPYYGSYRSNPRGTYYGNSATRSSTNQSGWGLGGTTRQVRGASGTPVTRGYNRPIADFKPTGSNTVSGIAGRSGRGELRGRGSIPTGGVADLRSAGASFRGLTNSGTQFDRQTPVRRGTTITTPSANDYRPSTTERTVRTRDRYEPSINQQQNRYERPTERPTRIEPTTRPVERRSTYEQPSTYQRSTPTYSRPSGGGGGGGGIVARPSRGR